jgi:hypothetical protein
MRGTPDRWSNDADSLARQTNLMQRFIDDDDGYLSWISSHPDGFVLNTHRKPQPSYLRLHRSTCPSIAGTPANGSRWTVTYIKLCGSRAQLESWAKKHMGSDVWDCPRCI